MKKVLAITLALVAVAAFAWAQPGPPAAPDCPSAPKAPHASGHGMAPGAGCCNMHGGMSGDGMRGCGKMHHGVKGCGMKGRHMMGTGGGMPGGFLRHADEIGLTEDQQAKLREMRVKHQVAMADARADVQKARIKLQGIRADDRASEADVMKAIDVLSEARATIEKMRYGFHQDCKAVLTPQQLDKMEQFRQDKREQRMEDRQQRQSFRDRRFRSSR